MFGILPPRLEAYTSNDFENNDVIKSLKVEFSQSYINFFAIVKLQLNFWS